MAYETISYEKKDHIATITLNRPQALNSFSLKMNSELYRIWDDVKFDPQVRVAVVTGAGDRAFCTGVDVKESAELGAIEGMDAEDRYVDTGHKLRITARMNDCFKPVITAVNGMVVGGGLHFIADTDICICAENATFFDTHLEIGWVSWIEPIGLSRRVPLERIMRMVLMGSKERIDAREAYRIGLVSQVVPLKDLVPTATQLAATIAEKAPLATMLAVEAIWRGLDMGMEEAKMLGAKINRVNLVGHDYIEGPKAFAEKRKPQWQGR
ncbi:MAG: enoyl-CoA hydratase/isomerase family protein [Chloroflexi bacterium]|nr:enoyl-CoA hydratase/isomerase family protein [Chloroflexota bacterium]